MYVLNGFFALAVFLLALSMRPWRMLKGSSQLLTPLLAALVITPWLWSLPWLQHMPIQLQWSGACLITLCLGWPLAIPVLFAIAAISGLLASLDWATQLDLLVWLGLLPASLCVGFGWLVRRFLPHNLFVYIFVRAFMGTILCLFAANMLAYLTGHRLATSVDPELAWIARWLLAWGDGMVTGMLVAVFVAFRPQWLATWADRIYLLPKNTSQSAR